MNEVPTTVGNDQKVGVFFIPALRIALFRQFPDCVQRPPAPTLYLQDMRMKQFGNTVKYISVFLRLWDVN
jgi:hypothetical protein